MIDFDPSLHYTPGDIVFFGGSDHEIVRITKDGHVILGPSAKLDEAALAFWQAIEQLSPGTCQRILNERK